MPRLSGLLKVLVPLGVAGAAATSVLHERRHPEPFPVSKAAFLDTALARRGAEKLINALRLTPGMRVLDVGAGIGRVAIPIAEKVGPTGEVVALDVQQEMLDRLNKRAADSGITNIRTIRAAAGDGAIDDTNFDRALLVAVLGEIPPDRRMAALREIRTALGLDGVLYIFEGIGDPHVQSRNAITRLGVAAGFTVVLTRRLGLAHLYALRPEPPFRP
jgi:ubiquinone/menaquinone biosynthesis C-methylase UbiE